MRSSQFKNPEQSFPPCLSTVDLGRQQDSSPRGSNRDAVLLSAQRKACVLAFAQLAVHTGFELPLATVCERRCSDTGRATYRGYATGRSQYRSEVAREKNEKG